MINKDASLFPAIGKLFKSKNILSQVVHWKKGVGIANLKRNVSSLSGLTKGDKANVLRQIGKTQRDFARKGYLNKVFPTGKGTKLVDKIPNAIIKKTPIKYMDRGYSDLAAKHMKQYFKEFGQDVMHPGEAMRRVFSHTKYKVKTAPLSSLKDVNKSFQLIKRSPVSRATSSAFVYGIPAWFAVEPWTAKRFKNTSTAGKIVSSVTGGGPDLITRKALPIMGFNWISEAMAKNKAKKVAEPWMQARL